MFDCIINNGLNWFFVSEKEIQPELRMPHLKCEHDHYKAVIYDIRFKYHTFLQIGNQKLELIGQFYTIERAQNTIKKKIDEFCEQVL